MNAHAGLAVAAIDTVGTITLLGGGRIEFAR